MKRKRGHKKGKKSKKSKSESIDNNVENQTSEQSYEAPVECENSEHETKMEVEAPSSTGSGNSPNAESVDADKNAVAKSVGRVKVKLKSSKAPEPDEKSRNDVDKSSSQVVSEVPVVVVEKKEEFVPRLPERRPLFLNVYRKTKGIKIKSSKAVEGSSSSVTEKVADAVKVPDAVVIQKDTKTVEEKYQANKKEPESVPISVPKEEKKTDQSSRYNKQELEDSLTVIKKIMKMEAADPFNVPVNPEALGIPISMEEFVSQPGRECLTKLHPHLIGGATWFQFSDNGISKSINRMLNGMLRHPYATYSSMPMEERELWFRQFAQEFTWDSQITSTVRREFDSKASQLYSRKLNEWKVNKVPKELEANPTLWNGLIDYWKQETTSASSRSHSSNRMSTRKGKGIATHNLGATSKATREKQLFQEDGVCPSHLRLLQDTHTNRKTGQVQDHVAREIIESVTKLGEEWMQSQPTVEGTPPLTEVPVDKLNALVYEATPKTKGRIFGLPQEYYSSPSTASSQFSGDYELREQLAEKTLWIESLKTKIETIEEQRQLDQERLRTIEEQRQLDQEHLRTIEDERRAYKDRLLAMEARMEAFFSKQPPRDH